MSTNDESQTVVEMLMDECRALTKHALTSGMNVPATVLQTVADCEANNRIETSPEELHAEVQRLANAHYILAQLVAPATPRAINLFAKQRLKYPKLCHFGPIPLVRWLIATAILLLTILISLSATEATNLFDDAGETIDWSIFNSSGTELMLRLSFLLSAAGLGASFAALFRANKYIVAGNYDPKYSVSYWNRIVLGLIAGVILSELIPLATPALQGSAKPILALLGGFSAATLYRILNRLVLALESIVQGDTREVIKSQQRALDALANQKLAQDQLQRQIQNPVPIRPTNNPKTLD